MADFALNTFDVHMPVFILYEIFFPSQSRLMFLDDLIVDCIF